MTEGAPSVTVWRLTRALAGATTQALLSMEVQFGSVACTRAPADRGTQVSERLGISLRFNHSLTVCFSRAGDKTYRGGRCFSPRLYFRTGNIASNRRAPRS